MKYSKAHLLPQQPSLPEDYDEFQVSSEKHLEQINSLAVLPTRSSVMAAPD